MRVNQLGAESEPAVLDGLSGWKRWRLPLGNWSERAADATQVRPRAVVVEKAGPRGIDVAGMTTEDP